VCDLLIFFLQKVRCRSPSHWREVFTVARLPSGVKESLDSIQPQFGLTRVAVRVNPLPQVGLTLILTLTLTAQTLALTLFGGLGLGSGRLGLGLRVRG